LGVLLLLGGHHHRDDIFILVKIKQTQRNNKKVDKENCGMINGHRERCR